MTKRQIKQQEVKKSLIKRRKRMAIRNKKYDRILEG